MLSRNQNQAVLNHSAPFPQLLDVVVVLVDVVVAVVDVVDVVVDVVVFCSEKLIDREEDDF